LGITLMQQRAKRIGGRLQFRAGPTGGCEVRCLLSRGGDVPA
jgi:nitrate/nitrite-specific signal transduction histidine kinase